MGLVVRRKIGEKVFVGDDVMIQVVRVGRDGVKLLIEAPKNRPILREELLANQAYNPKLPETQEALAGA